MSRITFVLLLLLAAIYFTPIGLTGIDAFDEGIRVHGAERVYNGDVPYRDFYALYGPATFYWPAALFKVFGLQLVTFRVGLILFNALTAAAIFAFCRQMDVTAPSALMAYVLFLLPRNQDSIELIACDPAVALLFCAGTVFLSGNSPWKRIATGLLVGSAALFRQDFGAYGLAAVMVACCLRETTAVTFSSVKKVASEIGYSLLGVFLTAGVGYGLLAFLDWHALMTNLITYPALTTYYRKLPFPLRASWREFLNIQWHLSRGLAMLLFRWIVYVAPFALGVIGVPLAVDIWRRRLFPAGKQRAGLVFLIFLLPGFVFYGLGRSDWPHLFPLYALSVPLLTVLINLWCSASVKYGNWGRWSQFAAWMAAVLAFMMFLGKAKEYVKATPLPLQRTKFIVASHSDWLVNGVNDLSSESGPIFVAGERHDRVFINPIIVYFLSGRPSGTYFYQFDPGVLTTAYAQERIIADLERNKVNTIFVWRVELPTEPNLSSTSSGSKVLDHFLGNRYEEIKSQPIYRILKRRL